MSVRRRSIAWQYFTSLNSGKAVCNMCGNVLSFKGGGGPFNLLRHIKAKHLEHYEETKAAGRVAPHPVHRYNATANENQDTSSIPTETPDPAPNPGPASTSASAPSSTPPPVPALASPKAHLIRKEKKIKSIRQKPNRSPYSKPDQNQYRTAHDNSPPPPQKQRVQQDQNVHICSSCPCIAAQESEYDKIGKAWASELQKMSPGQQIYAKRAIAEIIFEGQLGALHRESVVINHVEQAVADRTSPVFFVEKEEPDFNY